MFHADFLLFDILLLLCRLCLKTSETSDICTNTHCVKPHELLEAEFRFSTFYVSPVSKMTFWILTWYCVLKKWILDNGALGELASCLECYVPYAVILQSDVLIKSLTKTVKTCWMISVVTILKVSISIHVKDCEFFLFSKVFSSIYKSFSTTVSLKSIHWPKSRKLYTKTYRANTTNSCRQISKSFQSV